MISVKTIVEEVVFMNNDLVLVIVVMVWFHFENLVMPRRCARIAMCIPPLSCRCFLHFFLNFPCSSLNFRCAKMVDFLSQEKVDSHWLAVFSL